ncbi:MAG: hypothetical protein RIC16_07185 [Rhodospirillales bacterium]
MSDELQRHKELLAAAQAEIEELRGKVGKCSTTILETVLAQEQQENEVTFLRARVEELEAILAESEETQRAAAEVIDAMQGAMGRMQETITKVTAKAKETLSVAQLQAEVEELEDAAANTLDPDELAEYNARIADLKERVRKKT